MERISREQMLMEVAHVVARRGTCSRAQVGVVFAREGRILATGYNGAPPGVAHCVHESYTVPDFGPSRTAPTWFQENIGVGITGSTYFFDGSQVTPDGRCTVVSHSERNAIAYAAREGIRLGDSDVFCTHAPCLDCARALLGTGIASLWYQVPYRLTAGTELLRTAGIKVVDLSAEV